VVHPMQALVRACVEAKDDHFEHKL